MRSRGERENYHFLLSRALKRSVQPGTRTHPQTKLTAIRRARRVNRLIKFCESKPNPGCSSATNGQGVIGKCVTSENGREKCLSELNSRFPDYTWIHIYTCRQLFVNDCRRLALAQARFNSLSRSLGRPAIEISIFPVPSARRIQIITYRFATIRTHGNSIVIPV